MGVLTTPTMKRVLLNFVRRCSHSSAGQLKDGVLLRNRGLIEVTGVDGRLLVNGLSTADVLSAPPLAQYNMFLNAQGRVLYDSLIYHVNEERMLIECDKMIERKLLNHLKMYALRKKVIVQLCANLSVIAAPANIQPHPSCVLTTPDPRLESLGQRFIAPAEGSYESRCDDYHQLRLRMGVAEGAYDIPPGQLLPFELNLDYLQGVSFTKGCYLGQELTARTHHTGVVRRRAVPLTLQESSSGIMIPWGSNILLESGKKVGKVLSYAGSCLLGILRLPDVEQHEQVCVETPGGQLVAARWFRPDWWPAVTTE